MITPGNIYVLTKDHPALRPDKRQRYDWRAADMKAGTEFVVEQDEIHERTWSTLRKLGHPGSVAVGLGQLPETFTDLLQRVEHPTPTQYLRAHSTANCALEILDVLVAEGKITLDDVKVAEEFVVSR